MADKKKLTGTGNGGMGKEPWYKSRRMWSAILAGASAIMVQLGYADIASGVVVIAAGFGITSWVKPK